MRAFLGLPESPHEAPAAPREPRPLSGNAEPPVPLPTANANGRGFLATRAAAPAAAPGAASGAVGVSDPRGGGLGGPHGAAGKSNALGSSSSSSEEASVIATPLTSSKELPTPVSDLGVLD
mmetsp:Transcript_57560/g.108346  ORF Transcript_57560/g.108346 Transcript_57560/m.108346 type:complete len:121 (+) Transcript_57560:1379-1741(+)